MARNVWTGQFAPAEQLRASTAGQNARGVCLHKPDVPRISRKGHRNNASPVEAAVLRKLGNEPTTMRIQRNPQRPPVREAEPVVKTDEQITQEALARTSGNFDSFAALAAAIDNNKEQS